MAAQELLKRTAVMWAILISQDLMKPTDLRASQAGSATGPVHLSAGDLDLTFAAQSGALISAKDKKTGVDLIESPDGETGAGWSLTLTTAGGPKATADHTHAAHFRSEQARVNGHEQLRLHWEGLVLSDGATLPQAVVSVEITPLPADSSSLWEISFTGLNPYRIAGAQFPDLQPLGDLSTDGKNLQLFVPDGAGRVFRDPQRTLTAGSWPYPLRASMQFAALYGPTTGFYLAAQDFTGERKSFSWQGRSPTRSASRLALSHTFRNPEGQVNIAYPVQLGIFHGDWQTAAGIYRQWSANAPWVQTHAPRSRLLDNTLLTSGLRPDTPAGKEARTELQKRTAGQIRAYRAPVIASLGDWAQLRGPTQSLDSRPEMGWAAFESAVRFLHLAGAIVGVDLNAYCMDVNTRDWTAGPAKSFASTDPSGAPRIYPAGSGSCAAMRIGSPLWQTMIRGGVGTLREHGVDLIALDLWPESESLPTEDILFRDDISDMQSWAELLRNSDNPGRAGGSAIGSGQPTEMLLAHLQFFRTRTCNPEAGLVPAFDFVYHSATSVDCYLANRPPLRAYARALVTGERIVTNTMEDDSGEAALFLKQATAARRTFASAYLVQGTMLPSVAIEGPLISEPTSAANGALSGRGTPGASVSSLESGVWRAPNGDTGIVLANISPQMAPATISVNFDRWDLHPGRDYSIRMLSAGGPVIVGSGVQNTTTVNVSINSLDVAVLTIHEEPDSGRRIRNVTNAASGDEHCGVAPGEIIDINGDFGEPLRTQSADVGQRGMFPLEIDGTRVFIAGSQAAILLASPELVRAIVPWNVAGKQTIDIRVIRGPRISSILSVHVSPACPGLYASGTVGLALARGADGILNSELQPAGSGDVLTLYSTGLGLADTQPQAGAVFQGDGHIQAKATVEVSGIPVKVEYAGFSQTRFTGVYELRIVMPPGLKSGIAPIAVGVGDEHSQDLNIVVR